MTKPSEPFGLEPFRELVLRKIGSRFFERDNPIIITRAPGRLDLMGGIADYSGSLVLQYPIKEATFVAAQLSDDPTVKLESVSNTQTGESFLFKAELSAFRPGGKLSDAASARRYFAANRKQRWAAYAAGAFVILADALGLTFDRGLRILIHTDVPLGKGVSSSAALEVAVMKAVCELHPAPALESRDLALLCQRVENEIVGAPCGVMDQMTSACGTANSLIELICQPAELRGTISLPDELNIWGIDSGIRHSVAGTDYGTVRTAAFMGYRIMADLAGLSIEKSNEGCVKIDDPKWKGYLANVDPAEFEADFSECLPTSVAGQEFLDKYYGVTDPHSTIDARREYPVRAATSHPVYESARVRRFAELIRTKPTETDLIELGSLMYASHESYSSCGLGSDGTDLLVDLVRTAGTEMGLYGGKITGGGSGGTVAVLGRKGSQSAIESIARDYEKRSGRLPYIFTGSSPGAFQFGTEKFDPSQK